MKNVLVSGIVIGLVIGVLANPLMPPAFFVVGGLAIWAATRLSSIFGPKRREGD